MWPTASRGSGCGAWRGPTRTRWWSPPAATRVSGGAVLAEMPEVGLVVTPRQGEDLLRDGAGASARRGPRAHRAGAAARAQRRRAPDPPARLGHHRGRRRRRRGATPVGRGCRRRHAHARDGQGGGRLQRLLHLLHHPLHARACRAARRPPGCWSGCAPAWPAARRRSCSPACIWASTAATTPSASAPPPTPPRRPTCPRWSRRVLDETAVPRLRLTSLEPTDAQAMLPLFADPRRRGAAGPPPAPALAERLRRHAGAHEAATTPRRSMRGLSPPCAPPCPTSASPPT